MLPDRCVLSYAAALEAVGGMAIMGGIYLLSRCLRNAMATACLSAFPAEAGLEVPIRPVRRQACMSSRMLAMNERREEPR